jgi:hypothetical protein
LRGDDGATRALAAGRDMKTRPTKPSAIIEGSGAANATPL